MSELKRQIEHSFSRLIKWFAESENPLIARPLVWSYTKWFDIDLHEYEHEAGFSSLKALFTRRLKFSSRAAPDAKHFLSPCDGRISACGSLDQTGDGQLLIKGSGFCPRQLVGDDWFKSVQGGEYMVIYLSPKDYHHFHSPVPGLREEERRYFRGRKRTVKPESVDKYPLFLSENERIACKYIDQQGHSLIMVYVGAMIVGSIELNHYADLINQGENLGHFNFGSTIVLFTPPGYTKESLVQNQGSVQLFDSLGELSHAIK